MKRKSLCEEDPMNDTEYFTGSGNVFADIGLPNTDEHLIKAQLVYRSIIS